MKLTTFELDIVKAIGKHYPVVLGAVDLLEVRTRENTGAGMYIDFEPLENKLESHTQILDLHGTITVPNAELSAHIEMKDGIPLFLEICCLNWGGWDGSHNSYVINN